MCIVNKKWSGLARSIAAKETASSTHYAEVPSVGKSNRLYPTFLSAPFWFVNCHSPAPGAFHESARGQIEGPRTTTPALIAAARYTAATITHGNVILAAGAAL